MQLHLDESVASTSARVVCNYVGAQRKGVVVHKAADGPMLSVDGAHFTELATVARTLARLADQPELLGGPDPLGMAVQEEWLSRAAACAAGDKNGVVALAKDMNDQLLLTSFIAGGSAISLADLVAYAILHPFVVGLKSHQGFTSLVRWFDHVQHQPSLHETHTGLSHLTVQHTPYDIFSGAAPSSPPTPAKGGGGEKKKKKKEEEGGGGNNNNTDNKAKQSAGKAEAGKKEKKKEKKEEKKEKKGPVAGGAPIIGKLCVVVGKVLEVVGHPTEERLYVTQIEVGEGKPRTVVCGVASFISKDALTGSLVLCILNLKPGDVKGVMSAGRCLVATGSDGTTKEMCVPPAGAKVGERVQWEGATDEVIDCNTVCSSKHFSKILKDLNTSDARVVRYRDFSCTTSGGRVVVPTVAGGIVA